MSEAVTLDGLRREAEKRYADYPVTLPDGSTVVLRAPLRLRTEERTQLRDMQTKISELQDDPNYSDADVLALLQGIVQVVADDADKGTALVEAIGDDLAILQTMFEDYTERTQSGEASPSAS